MSDSRSPFNPSNNPALARDAIAKSAEARETSRVQRLHRTLQALLDSARANPPATEAGRNHLFGMVLDALMVATEAHMGNLQLFDPEAKTLRIRVHRGFTPEFVNHFNSMQEITAACGAAFRDGAPVVVDNVPASMLFSPENHRVMAAAEARAVQSLALIHEGCKLGVISVHYRSPGIPLHNRQAFASPASLIAQIVAAAQP